MMDEIEDKTYFDPFKTHMRRTQTARTVTHAQTKHATCIKTQSPVPIGN